MSAIETRPKIELDSQSLQRSNRVCRQVVKQAFSKQLWVLGNLPGDRQVAVYALLNLMVRAADYLDLESTNGLPLDVWCEFRDDLGDAFTDKYTSLDLVALVDACRKYNVPRQYLFDLLDGVDHWIRNRRFETYDDVLVFAYRLGGAAMTAMVPVVGFIKPGYEESAIQAGQAILLTNLLGNIVQDIKLNKVFVAHEDLVETDVSISRIKVRQPSKELKHLVRLYGARIEKLMYQGGKLADFLDFDARRSFTSLMAMHWEMLMKMRLEPDCVLNPEGILSRRDLFLLKTKHVMGLEGNIPVISDVAHHH